MARRKLTAGLASPVGMAGKRTITRTLAANTDDAVAYPLGTFVELINDSTLTDGTGVIWYTLDGTLPAINGAGSRPLPAGTSDKWESPDNGVDQGNRLGHCRVITATASTPYTVQV